MITGLPSVSALKRLRSSGKRHGNAPLLPMTLFSLAATTKEIMELRDSLNAALSMLEVKS